jgi:hypothetical protein
LWLLSHKANQGAIIFKYKQPTEKNILDNLPLFYIKKDGSIPTEIELNNLINSVKKNLNG